MIRLLLCACLSLVLTSLPALDTPLIVNSPNSLNTVIINPTLGTMTLYSVLDGQLNRKASSNFLADITYLENVVYSPDVLYAKDPDAPPVPALQLGSLNNSPNMKDMLFKVIGSVKPSKKEAAAGVSTLLQRALAAEKEFWGVEHKFDGVVRAALSNTYLMLGIPSKRLLMLYEMPSENFVLVAYHNYGPELYIPQTYNSNPSPDQILAQLPADLQEEHKEQLKDQMEALVAANEQALKIAESDLWIVAGQADKFFVIDIANLHAMAFTYNGKELQTMGVRNLQVDLMIPAGFRTQPDIQGIFRELGKDQVRQRWMKDNGYENDIVAFKALVEQKAAGASGGKISTFQANIFLTGGGGDITLDFGDKRKVAVYRMQNALDLTSIRDYTLDVGIAMLDAEINLTVFAGKLLDQARQQSKNRNYPAALITLTSALKMNPRLVKPVEKEFAKDLGKLPGWPELIEGALARAEQLDKDAEARRQTAKDEREKKKPKK